jgi:hypothetical protein
MQHGLLFSTAIQTTEGTLRLIQTTLNEAGAAVAEHQS